MLKRRKSHAVDALFLIGAASIYKNPGFVERCDLVWMNLLYIEMIDKVFSNSRGGGSVEGELVRLRLKVERLSIVTEKTPVPGRSAYPRLTAIFWTILTTIWRCTEAFCLPPMKSLSIWRCLQKSLYNEVLAAVNENA